MVKCIFVAAIAIATAASAQAENLIKIFEMNNGDTTFVDVNSIQSVGSSKRFWQVEKLATPDKYSVVLRRTYMEFDCNAKMRTQRAYVDYDTRGAVVASNSSLDRPGEWRPIVPGSNGELIRLIVCSR